MRIAGMLSGIDYSRIESGAWKSNKEEIASLTSVFKKVRGSPFYYKNIAGRSVSYVIPIVRKFFHRYVRESVGDDIKCFVIYDYIKLYRPCQHSANQTHAVK